MAKEIVLDATPRTVQGKEVSKLRKQGIIPGVVYGWHVTGPTPIQVEERIFEKVYRQAGANTLINLNIGQGVAGPQVLIHRITRDPVSQILNHFDLMAVNPRAEMSSDVPIVIIGEAPGAKAADAILMHELNTVHVHGLPADLPHTIEVDVTGLEEVDQAIYVKDLNIPSNVTLLTDPELIVVKLAQLRISAEDAAIEAEAAALAEAQSAESAEAAVEAEAAEAATAEGGEEEAS